MPNKHKEKVPEALVVNALAQIEKLLPQAAAAADTVDSVLWFLLNHRIEHVPQFTLLKESNTHYRHLAQVFCPQAKAAISELLPKKNRKQTSGTSGRRTKVT